MRWLLLILFVVACDENKEGPIGPIDKPPSSVDARDCECVCPADAGVIDAAADAAVSYPIDAGVPPGCPCPPGRCCLEEGGCVPAPDPRCTGTSMGRLCQSSNECGSFLSCEQSALGEGRICTRLCTRRTDCSEQPVTVCLGQSGEMMCALRCDPQNPQCPDAMSCRSMGPDQTGAPYGVCVPG